MSLSRHPVKGTREIQLHQDVSGLIPSPCKTIGAHLYLVFVLVEFLYLMFLVCFFKGEAGVIDSTDYTACYWTNHGGFSS